MKNGDMQQRLWLVYSTISAVFFVASCSLCYKDTTKLASIGFMDWNNTEVRLSQHETSQDHIMCMSQWMELQMRLQKNQTINKCVQEEIKKEKRTLERAFTQIIYSGKVFG